MMTRNTHGSLVPCPRASVAAVAGLMLCMWVVPLAAQEIFDPSGNTTSASFPSQVKGVDGSASIPSYSFTGDQDTACHGW